MVAGAGIAAALFGAFLIASPFVCMGMLVGFGLSKAPYFLPVAAMLVTFIINSAWIVISALWLARMHVIGFFLCASITFGFLFCGWKQCDLIENRVQHEIQHAVSKYSIPQPVFVGKHRTMFSPEG